MDNMVAFVPSISLVIGRGISQSDQAATVLQRPRQAQRRRAGVIFARQDAPVTRRVEINPESPSPDPGKHANDERVEENQVKDRKMEDLVKTLGMMALAGLVASGFAYFEGNQRALEFVTGYVVEYSLSVDNLFVFLLIFEFFKVPRASQERVLGFGIIGAMVLRGIMIVLGASLTHRFRAVTVGFAALLLYSASKLLFEDEEENEDLEKNSIVRFSRKLLPFTDQYDGDKFFTVQNGAKLATPLMLVLLCVELSDVVFALDSVPAILGISQDTKVVYGSNIMAIMGLRNLYFLLSDSIGGLRFLRPSLAIVLGFVGAKMLAGVGGFEVGTVQSLLVILGTLGGGVGLSLAYPGVPKEE